MKKKNHKRCQIPGRDLCLSFQFRSKGKSAWLEEGTLTNKSILCFWISCTPANIFKGKKSKSCPLTVPLSVFRQQTAFNKSCSLGQSTYLWCGQYLMSIISDRCNITLWLNVMWLLRDAVTFDARVLYLETCRDKVTWTVQTVWELHEPSYPVFPLKF